MRARRLPFAALLLASCISGNPPAPPVRWFDPMPALPAPLAAPGIALPPVNVTASPTVRQDFVLRIGARELAIDELHRWSAPPDRLLQAAIDQALFGPGGGVQGGAAIGARVLRFELDLCAQPCARVELQLLTGKGLANIEGRADAASRDPEALAAAMAAAVAQAVVQVRAALATGG